MNEFERAAKHGMKMDKEAFQAHKYAYAVEEVFGITWMFAGEKLLSWQAAERLYRAGWKEAQVLQVACAVMMSESGNYLKAWHHNVDRNPDGTVKLTAGLMRITSTDLGFCQENVPHNPPVAIPFTASEAQGYIEQLFDAYPEYANGILSAQKARSQYEDRGWQPWYAHSNGSYRRSMPWACTAIANMLDHQFANGSGTAIQRTK